MKEYISIIHNLIEVPRNELRIKFMKTKDKKLEVLLKKYEEAYYRSCLKVEAYIEHEMESKDLNPRD